LGPVSGATFAVRAVPREGGRAALLLGCLHDLLEGEALAAKTVRYEMPQADIAGDENGAVA